MGYAIIRFYVDEAKSGTTTEGRILGTIPFGYIADKDNKFSIVDKEADIVRCAFENYMGKIKNNLDNPKNTEQITCFFCCTMLKDSFQIDPIQCIFLLAQNLICYRLYFRKSIWLECLSVFCANQYLF